MAEFKNIYDRPAQPYSVGEHWKVILTTEKQHREITLSPDEIALITDFINYKTISAQISPTRKINYVSVIRAFKRVYPDDILSLTGDKLFAAINAINASEDYQRTTKTNIVTMLKVFFKYAAKKGRIPGLTFEDVMEIKPLPAPATVKRPDDLPTPDEIHTITSDPHCSVMYSALINTMYYTGGRASEILGLNWGDIVFENQFVKVTIKDTKDNKIRYVPCVQALPFLAAWRRQYPTSIIGGPERNNPVFVTLTPNGYRRLQYMNARNAWIRLQDRSNTHPRNDKKYYGFHTLRAAHITNLAAANVPDAVIRDIAWGNQNTQMMSKYLLLSDKTKENLILESAGIQTEKETKVENAVVLCPKCNAPNGPRDSYCRYCGEPLNAHAREVREVLEESSKHCPADILGFLSRELGVSKDVLKEKLMNSL